MLQSWTRVSSNAALRLHVKTEIRGGRIMCETHDALLPQPVADQALAVRVRRKKREAGIRGAGCRRHHDGLGCLARGKQKATGAAHQ